MDAALLAALMVIDNVLRHEPAAPPHAPPMVRELLAHPREAQDTETIFRRSVPAVLLDGIHPPIPPEGRMFPDVLSSYLPGLFDHQTSFQEAVRPFHALPPLRRLADGLPS